MSSIEHSTEEILAYVKEFLDRPQVQDLLLLSIQKLFNICQYLLCGVFYTRLLLFIFTGPGPACVVYPEAL
jgi:hypothetical protein